MSAPIDINHVPLSDHFFQITGTEWEFELYELHIWLKQKYLDKQDEVKLLETLLPLYTFPQTLEFHDLVTWCQASYDPLKKKLVAQNKEILISITSETINQMFSIPPSDSLGHFSQATHMDLYQTLNFP